MIRAGVTFKQVDPPNNHICSSGHTAKGTFKVGGSQDKPTPTRFFEVYTEQAGLVGTFCEPCLVIANYLRRQRKVKHGI